RGGAGSIGNRRRRQPHPSPERRTTGRLTSPDHIKSVAMGQPGAPGPSGAPPAPHEERQRIRYSARSPRPGRTVIRTVLAARDLLARRIVTLTLYTPARRYSCSAVKRRSSFVPVTKGGQSPSCTLLPPSSQSHSSCGQ